MNPYIETIKKHYSKFETATFKHIDHGQNNEIFIVNDKTIFRFPKSELNHRTLHVEYDCLNILREKLSFKIPEFKYVNFGENLIDTYVGYDLIEGETLLKDVLLRKDRFKVGFQLSEILKELHQPKLKELMESRVKVFDTYMMYEDMYNRIKNKLFPYMREEKKDEVRRNFEEILHALEDVSYEPTLVHGDFGPTNIIIDKNNSMINGIIDFGAIHIGDPAVDISSLIGPFGYGPSFILETFDAYPEAKDMLKRAILYTKTFALQEALYGIENDDKRAFDAGMETYI